MNSILLASQPSLLASTIYEPISYKLDQSRLILSESEKIDESLLCGICQEIVHKPEECSICQNLFCSNCIRSWLEKQAKCPYNCPPPFQASRPHKLIRQALSSLKYSCINKENGCEEVIAMENLEKHEGKCGFGKIKCPISELCSEEIMRKDLENHEKICEFFLLKCEKCEFSVARKVFPNHDCILYLKEKYLTLEKKFIDFKENNEKNVETLMKKVMDFEVLLKTMDKSSIKYAQHEKVCQRGHNLEWGNGCDIKECDLCKKKNVFSRFACGVGECGLKYCINCVFPFLGAKKCPIGHDLVGCSKMVWHSCDLCRKGLDKENEVYRDEECDFDCCKDCFLKASK